LGKRNGVITPNRVEMEVSEGCKPIKVPKGSKVRKRSKAFMRRYTN